MKRQVNIKALLLIPAILLLPQLAVAEIQGLSGTSFSLTAKAGHISTGDGNSLLVWGFADDSTGQMQYPGPTLILDEDVEVTVTLSNELAENVSIVFPGQSGIATAGGTAGLMTQEVEPGNATGTVTYTFTPTEPGTYMYQSGTRPEAQIEMGLVGAIIVRPSNFDTLQSAYGSAATAYDREFLFFLSEMDGNAHAALDVTVDPIPLDPASYDATFWFVNGRNFPDTAYADGADAPWLPAQPYGALARAHPSDRVLMRVIGGGRDLHPFHFHGNNAWQIAQDGRVLESAPGAEASYPEFRETNVEIIDGSPADWLPNGTTIPDQSISNFTVTVTPGSTYDLIFTWTGKGLNWDIYGNRDGHRSTDAICTSDPDSTLLPTEDPTSHCKDLTVTLPEQQALTFGGFWSGSPYLGALDVIPPLEGGLNPDGGFAFMWHSHAEKEIANDDIFPGGMITFMIVEDTSVPLD